MEIRETVKEINERRRKLSEDIGRLVDGFENETGLTITQIEIRFLAPNQAGRVQEQTIRAIAVTLML